ncbi:hypothetical protein CL619_00985 [archaeon]|nr:hypothetical protein [archaeon]|tara:strand:+ start:356 stop:1783 length:1428 start_codon:yes stop_codon:yes gene_type:complete
MDSAQAIDLGRTDFGDSSETPTLVDVSLRKTALDAINPTTDTSVGLDGIATMRTNESTSSDYVVPTNYSLLADDILSGLGRRSLESRFNNYSHENGFKVLGGYEVIQQIGTNPCSGYELGIRDNWALKDRLTNFDAVVDQMFNDYRNTEEENGNYVLPSNVDTFLDEISSLESLLKDFDVSKRRLSRVKNPQSVQFKHKRILQKLADKKKEVAKQHGIELENTELTDLANLAEGILSGASSHKLQYENGANYITRNHSWDDRLNNFSFLAHKVFKGNANNATGEYNPIVPEGLSVEQYQNLKSKVETLATTLDTYVPCEKRLAKVKRGKEVGHHGTFLKQIFRIGLEEIDAKISYLENSAKPAVEVMAEIELETPSDVILKTLKAPFGYITLDGTYVFHDRKAQDVCVGGKLDENNVFRALNGDPLIDLDEKLSKNTPKETEEAMQQMQTLSLYLPDTPSYVTMYDNSFLLEGEN